MSLKHRLKHELETLAVAMLYFGSWIAALLLLKQLVLAEYHIEFNRISMALIGALILSKVVIVLEHVSLGAWIRKQPAWVDVILRTALYSAGLAVVLVLEKGFEGRHEHGGFGPSVVAVFRETDTHHVWVNSLCLSAALLGYNALSVVRHYLGKWGLLKMFLTPRPQPGTPGSDAAQRAHQAPM